MTVQTLDITEATRPLAEYAQKADLGPILIMADGQPLAVIIGAETIDLEALSLSTNPQFLSLIEKSRKRQKKEGGISSDERWHF
ncbi:MAG: hypothetical protein HND44_21055 [Chloroflexi bacterium]|nr:hypothetical protein [Ardenticatenaceae bacterium]MBL1130935.1 hypothetical protein [Chloroflexota bacterium]NOG37031.1 hypothetical protein [Chloroflexota bacterium]